MPRAGVREERLRSTTGIRQAMPMSSWRGASGRRYVVGVQTAITPDMVDMAGTASVVDVAAPEPGATRRARLRWLALMRTRGATEMHVHLLAEGAAERDAVRRDLAGDAQNPA